MGLCGPQRGRYRDAHTSSRAWARAARGHALFGGAKASLQPPSAPDIPGPLPGPKSMAETAEARPRQAARPPTEPAYYAHSAQRPEREAQSKTKAFPAPNPSEGVSGDMQEPC